jgi:hypothetical protein
MTAAEQLPDAAKIIEALLAEIADLKGQVDVLEGHLQTEREVSDHWRTRATDLDSERFAR